MLLCAAMIFSLAASSSLRAQSQAAPAKFEGVWRMTSLTPDGDSVPWRLTLKEQGGKLVGTIGGEQGDAPLSNLKVEGSKIHFTTPYDGEDYDQDLEMEGTKLVGTWSGNGNSGKTTGERTAGG